MINSKENQFYTYGLADPRKLSKESYVGGISLHDYEFFYFGYSGREERIDEHLACKKSDKNMEKKNIIKEIQSAGKEVIIVKIIENVDEYTAIKKEIERIAYYGRADLDLGPLTNKTNGGDGGCIVTPLMRDKISQSLKEGYKSGEIVPWNKGLTKETNEILRQLSKSVSETLTGRKGIPLTDYQKECISKAHTGKVVSKESRQKQSEAQKGRIPWNKGLKGAQVAWNKGKHIPRKTYYFKRDEELIEIKDLKIYCKENNINYSCMVALHNATGQYKTRGKYKNYERIED